MGTTTALDITITTPGEILGPSSDFGKKVAELRKEVAPVIQAANELKVTGGESADEATKLGRLLQAALKERTLIYKQVKQQVDDLKRPILDAEREDANAINSAKDALGVQITEYNREQERLRQEAERVAREAAEKAAREAQLEKAIQLDLEGDEEGAEAVLEEPAIAPVVIKSTVPAHVRGQVTKKKYSAELTSLKQLVDAIAAGTVPVQAVKADMSYLNKLASANKESYNIPGTRLITQESTHFRA